MSNHLAIATVTAAFVRLLAAAAQTGVGQATVRLGPPDAKLGQDNKPVVNLFLYQVEPNAQRRNAHMPGRRADGSLAARSRIALDLRYLVSFYGDGAKFEPERMMGAVAVAVEDRPLFTAELVQRAVQDNQPVLDGSNLDKALSTVRITPETHSLDELSKMWSIFFQVPYALSTSYLCSHVSVEVGEEPQPALPVATPRIFAGPLLAGGIDVAEAADGPAAPVVWGGTLVIRGRRLDAPGLTLRIGGHDIVPAPGEATANELRLKLEAPRFGGAELPAGIHTVQAVFPGPPGAPAQLARTSEIRVFALRPKLTVADAEVAGGSPPDVASGAQKIDFSPKVAESQTVRLMLDERTAADPQAVTLAPEAPASFPAGQLVFEYAGLRRAKFLVRAQVDGVDSALDIDAAPGSATFGQIVGPEADLS